MHETLSMHRGLAWLCFRFSNPLEVLARIGLIWNLARQSRFYLLPFALNVSGSRLIWTETLLFLCVHTQRETQTHTHTTHVTEIYSIYTGVYRCFLSHRHFYVREVSLFDFEIISVENNGNDSIAWKAFTKKNQKPYSFGVVASFFLTQWDSDTRHSA